MFGTSTYQFVNIVVEQNMQHKQIWHAKEYDKISAHYLFTHLQQQS